MPPKNRGNKHPRREQDSSSDDSFVNVSSSDIEAIVKKAVSEALSEVLRSFAEFKADTLKLLIRAQNRA